MTPVTAAAIAGPSTQLPFTDDAGFIVVDAMVDGKGPFRFAIDTGSSTVVITPQLALKLDPELGEPEAINGAGKQREVAVKVTLSTFAVAGLAQAGVTAVVLPLPPAVTYQGRHATIDGFIGSSYLEHYALRVDLGRGILAMTPSASFDPPAGVPWIPMEVTAAAMPVVDAAVDGFAGRFEIDTGTRSAVVLTQGFVDAHAIPTQPGLHFEVHAIGGSTSVSRVRLRTTAFGPATLHDLAGELLGAPSRALEGVDGAFGYDLLRRFDATLDYAQHRLYLTPNQDYDAYAPFVGTGIERDRTANGSMIVVGVVGGSPAAAAGIQPGDEILAVGGRDVREMSDAEYERAVGTSPGSRAAYTIRSGSERRTVTLRAVDLLAAPPAPR